MHIVVFRSSEHCSWDMTQMLMLRWVENLAGYNVCANIRQSFYKVVLNIKQIVMLRFLLSVVWIWCNFFIQIFAEISETSSIWKVFLHQLHTFWEQSLIHKIMDQSLKWHKLFIYLNAMLLIFAQFLFSYIICFCKRLSIRELFTG